MTMSYLELLEDERQALDKVCRDLGLLLAEGARVLGTEPRGGADSGDPMGGSRAVLGVRLGTVGQGAHEEGDDSEDSQSPAPSLLCSGLGYGHQRHGAGPFLKGCWSLHSCGQSLPTPHISWWFP